MYATLVDPDRSQDWQPDPTAPLGETIDRFLRCAVLSNPEVCETGYAAMDFLRRDPESVLSLLEESTSEEAVLAWCAGTAPPGARAPGGALRLAALLGTADGCSMAADRAELLFERYGVLLEEFVGRRQETYGFSKTEEGHALSRHLSAMRGAIDQIISGSGIGSCPHLRPFCRARIEERNSRYVSICASYLAWVFPNERLPSAGPPADDHWPDPPYWTPLE